MPPGENENGDTNTSEVNQDLNELEESETPETPETPDEEEEEVEENEEESEHEEEEEEEEEQEEEQEEEAEEKPEEGKEDEVVTPSRPTLKQIQAKYPNLFKEFPDLKHAMFREREYTSVFPTIDDAKEAAEKSESLDKLEQLVTSGAVDDFQSFLSSAESAKEGSLKGIAAVFLPSLYRLNQDLYFQTTSPLIESVLRTAYKAGVDNSNEDLKNAALHVAKHVFGDVKYATGEKFTPPPKAVTKQSDPKFEEEKNQFYAQRFNEARDRVSTRADRAMRRAVKEGLDPEGAMNEFTSGLLIDKIMDEVGHALQADKAHMKGMNALWKRAHQAGFAGNWEDRILSAYLSRAKAIMPAIRKRLRQSATDSLGKPGDRVPKKNGSSATRQHPSHDQQHRPSGGGGGKRIDWSKTSDADFLADKITYKK